MPVGKIFFIAVVALLVIIPGIIFLANRFAVQSNGPLQVQGGDSSETAGDAISVVTWNLGYGGLGEESDFIADGGKSYMPESKEVVQKNIAGIIQQVRELDSDAYFFQEVVTTSPLNYGQNLLASLVSALSSSYFSFDPEIESHLLPPPLQLSHGAAIFTHARPRGAKRVLLPTAGQFYLGMIRRNYRMMVTYLPVSKSNSEWVLINIHTEAFDENAEVRKAQIEAILNFAGEEFKKGNHVVIGGDWNLEFKKSSFPHTTDDKYLFWIHEFPKEHLPEGWQLGFDPDTPTVRTVQSAYKRGHNYVTNIDGFIVSPNVSIEKMTGVDTSFKYSDHQPVLGKFKAH